MKKFTVTLLAVTLVAVGTIFAVGQTSDKPMDGQKRYGKHRKHSHFGQRERRGGMKRVFRYLDLTDEQKAQMKTIKQSSRENTKTLRQEMRQNRQQLQHLSENGQFDEAAVTALAAQQGQLHAQMIVEKLKVKSQIHNLLTAEQKTKLTEMKARFKKKMQERKAKWAERKAAKDAEQ